MELSRLKRRCALRWLVITIPMLLRTGRSRWRLTTPLRFWSSPLIMTGSPRLS